MGASKQTYETHCALDQIKPTNMKIRGLKKSKGSNFEILSFYDYDYVFLARLHEVHRAIVVTPVVPIYVYVYVRVTLSVKVFYKSISLDHFNGSN